MPALPALLLSIYVVVLLTMAPLSFSQANTLSAVRMGEYLHQHVTGNFTGLVQTGSLILTQDLLIMELDLRLVSLDCRHNLGLVALEMGLL